MTLDELKQEIEKRTGVPASLLQGNTTEDTLSIAKDLLMIRNGYRAHEAMTNAEKFSRWFNDQMGENGEPLNNDFLALDEIAEQVRIDNGGYPRTADPGEIDTSNMPDGRSTAEQFEEWMNKQFTFDPFRDESGWKKM